MSKARRDARWQCSNIALRIIGARDAGVLCPAKSLSWKCLWALSWPSKSCVAACPVKLGSMPSAWLLSSAALKSVKPLPKPRGKYLTPSNQARESSVYSGEYEAPATCLQARRSRQDSGSGTFGCSFIRCGHTTVSSMLIKSRSFENKKEL